ncbi:lipocalin family protein [Oceanimonas baumannii]|uniref:Outer membrane lipoprotein Blc n=1 Tax=Oceanimonas baumannii TaxID=129578 RepID=A0A235C9A0_9GAMM|nr:lipocalin family protein [Oceanimonas baumannii]OYD21210.1 lipocalin [Oceanimonas baumannii]TDW55290.1 apolipoprotein D and lipocalin family protein [Oceanimonas baumannii]
MKQGLLILLLFLAGCTAKPEGITPVSGFELNRYLGNWYEIARLDHRFERGLERVTASYSMREDGGVRVINRGFDTAKGVWKQAEGRAYFVNRPDIAHLKVSFFGPFYGAYVVFELDDNYQYALVSGPDRGYFWLLARTPELPPEVQKRLISSAREAGFATDELIFLEHRKDI